MLSENLSRVDWTDRTITILRALVVVACYLIVFAGLLYTVARGATP